jgi:hypothetical protein
MQEWPVVRNKQFVTANLAQSKLMETSVRSGHTQGLLSDTQQEISRNAHRGNPAHSGLLQMLSKPSQEPASVLNVSGLTPIRRIEELREENNDMRMQQRVSNQQVKSSTSQNPGSSWKHVGIRENLSGLGSAV